MKRSRKTISVFVFIIFLSSIGFSNGLNINGLGARAVAMGGAFVGLADDFTAMFWNPAGIAFLGKKTFGFTVDDIIPTGTYNYTHPLLGITLVDAEMDRTHNFTGMAAYYHPISENLVFGLGVYTPSGLASKWDGNDFKAMSFNSVYEWKSKIAVVTISPALAYKVSDQVSVGATLNINYGMFGISTHAGSQELQLDLGQQELDMKGWGYGATFGVLIKPSEQFSFGATLRTPSKIKFSGEATISKLNLLGAPTTTESSGEITYPMWICGGIALKPVENFTLTADLQYTNWKKIDTVEFEVDDPIWQLINASTGGNLELPLHWKNATQIRFGAEYRVGTIAFRCGYYIDPAPSPDETHNVLVPNYDFNSISFGFGYNVDGFHADFFVEYLKAKERTITAGVDNMPGVYNLSMLVPGVSIGFSW